MCNGQGQSEQVTKVGDYELPKGLIGLDGPVVRPAPGTLPLRGDLAHIALASRYLVPHYVVPQMRTIGDAEVALKRQSNETSDTVTILAAGSVFELLDHVGAWSWGCVGPDGPTGYILTAQLAKSD